MSRRNLAHVNAKLKPIGRSAKHARDFFEKHWKAFLRVRESIRISEETIHLLLASFIGVIGAFVNFLFFHSYLFMVDIIIGRSGDLSAVMLDLSWWQKILIPAAGGILAGLVLYWGLRIVGNQGSSNLLEVVVAGDGRLPLRTGLIKAISSLISISTGASIGREGLITQLTATVASKVGQFSNWQPYRLRLLVACGAASGLASAYNAPIAGAVFAAQIVLGNFAMNLFAPLILSAVVATMVSRSFFGLKPLYQGVPSFELTEATELAWFAALGILSGLIGAAFLKLLRQSEFEFNRLPIPLYGRIGAAGLVVGAIGFYYPEVWGNGYAALGEVLRQASPEVTLVLGLFFAKLIATVVTVGAGTVGGVFTPTLFLGGTVGSIFGVLLHQGDIALAMPVGAFALVGMGAVLAATIHSPLLAIIMIFELSLNHSLMLPLMLACAVSSLVARRLHPESVYTEPLRRKGLISRESLSIGAGNQRTVGDLLRTPVPPLLVTAPLREIGERFLTSSNNFLPVIDKEKRLLGMVALQDLKEHLTAGHELSSVIAYDVMRPVPPCLTPDQRLPDALPVLLVSEMRNIPVVNNLGEMRLIGSVGRTEALGLLSEAIAARSGSEKTG